MLPTFAEVLYVAGCYYLQSENSLFIDEMRNLQSSEAFYFRRVSFRHLRKSRLNPDWTISDIIIGGKEKPSSITTKRLGLLNKNANEISKISSGCTTATC